MPIDFNGLDSAVHGPLRLGILTALHVDGPLDFTTLKKRLAASDGAIGQHLLKLEEIAYLACVKAFVGRRPRTTYRITAAGRKALIRYLNQMQAIIDAVRVPPPDIR
jgi:DNA-binding PadR family transcriptional regulator